MKRKFILFLFLFFPAHSADSSIVYHFNGYNITETICQDGKANHHIESDKGIIFKLEGNGKKKYEYPTLHQSIHNTSTDGVDKFACTFKELDKKRSNLYIEKIKNVIDR